MPQILPIAVGMQDVADRHEAVDVVSRRLVRPSCDASWKTLPSPWHLGPIDFVNLPTIPVVSVAVYEKGDVIAELLPFERLQTALARLLDFYPQLSGRLAIASDGSLSLDHLGSGVALLQARCSERLDSLPRSGPSGQLTMPDLPTAGNALLAPFDATTAGVCRDSLLTVQHTRFACGSVSLGLRLLHVVADADAFFQLARDLATLYGALGDGRAVQEAVLDPAPHIVSHRSELRRKDMGADELSMSAESRPALFTIESSRVRIRTSDKPPPLLARHPVVGRVLRFSETDLASLKTAATAPDRSGWVSTFDALAAHLYQGVYRARVAQWSEEARDTLPCATLHIPVNVRRQLGLPPRFAANAPLTTTLALAPAALVDGPLWKVARAVHDLTRQHDIAEKDEIERTLRWIVAQPHKDEVKLHFALGDGALLVTSWNRFDAYPGVVYDGVRPTLVSQPFSPINLLDGIAFLLPTEAQTPDGRDPGGVDVNLSLSEPLWAILERDERFMRPGCYP